MVAFNFKREFSLAITGGMKNSTIRKNVRCQAGDAMQFYIGMTTKRCIKIADAVCESVDPIVINEDRVIIDNDIYRTQQQLKDFAYHEGFESWASFKKFFRKTYKLPFQGYLYTWKPIQPPERESVCMTDAKTILEMIENVDPADEFKLNEIDARAFCLIENETFIEMLEGGEGYRTPRGEFDMDPFSGWVSYTRSRDALKVIRPECCGFRIGNDADTEWFKCEMIVGYKDPLIVGYGDTEELAELHAIIKAIEFERTHEK